MYIYFDYKEHQLQTAAYVTITILKQLVIDGELLNELEQLYRDNTEKSKVPEETRFVGF